MGIIINLIEAIISTYSLSKLCHINRYKIYFCLNLVLTVLMEAICDYYNANTVPLAFCYIFGWYILLLFFTKKEYIYNLFMCIFNEMIITFTAMLPLIFISHYYHLLAAIEAKVFQLLVSLLFIKYQKKYQYFSNKYWVLIMMILVSCLLSLNLQGRIIIENQYTYKTIITVLLCMLVVILSLHFFYLLEESNNEKEKITKELEERKYQNATYDMMKRTKDELYRLEHSLTYYMMSIKNYLDQEKSNEIYEMIDHYLDRISNVNIVVYTGNDLFDLSLTTHLSQLSYKIDMCIMISKNEFYNRIQFIDFILSILDLINCDEISLLMKEDGLIKIIQISANHQFIDEKQLEKIFSKQEFESLYQIKKEEDLHILKIKIIEQI